jgi:hypothetical protein
VGSRKRKRGEEGADHICFLRGEVVGRIEKACVFMATIKSEKSENVLKLIIF